MGKILLNRVGLGANQSSQKGKRAGMMKDVLSNSFRILSLPIPLLPPLGSLGKSLEELPLLLWFT